MNNSIPSQVLAGIKQLGEEIGKEMLEQSGKIVTGVISAKELLGDIKPMGEAELAKKKEDEEKKKQDELAKLRSQMGQGRNVTSEIEEIRKQKEREEEEKRKAKLQEEKRVAQQPGAESQPMETISSNPSKQKKSRGSALMGGKRKKSQPTMQEMTQTGEVKGKID